MNKACTKCLIDKPSTDFCFRKSKRGEMYRHSICRACNNLKSKIWATLNAGRASETRKTWQSSNRDKRLSYYQQYRLLNKIRALNKYGGKCVACGCDEVAVLTFDHINGDGSKLRRAKKEKVGPKLHIALLKIPRRSDLQVMCMNCQGRKERYGSHFETWFSHPDNVTTQNEVF